MMVVKNRPGGFSPSRRYLKDLLATLAAVGVLRDGRLGFHGLGNAPFGEVIAFYGERFAPPVSFSEGRRGRVGWIRSQDLS